MVDIDRIRLKMLTVRHDWKPRTETDRGRRTASKDETSKPYSPEIAMLTFEASPGMTVMVVASKPTKAVQERVDKKVAACKCIIVDEDGVSCEEATYKRGLCSTHYNDYRTGLMQQALKDRAVWEARQIKLGRLLDSRQGQRLNKRNIFLSGR